MVLVLSTVRAGGDWKRPQTACAVIPVTTDTLDYLLGMMDQAAQLSEKLGKTITLGCPDWLPAWYADLPPEAMLTAAEANALDNGAPCLLADPLFPEPPAALLPEPPWLPPARQATPVPLSYCELRLTADTVAWWCGPKYGDVEEYTGEVDRALLEALAHRLRHQPSH